MINSTEKIIQLIQEAEKILLITHEHPDGDALGGMLGLKMSLESLGKSTQSVCVDEIPRPFLFLPKRQSIAQDFLLGDYDLIMILDCGDLRRTGFGERLKQFFLYKKKIINIDHHPKNDLHKLARHNIVDFKSSSTSEIIYKLLTELDIEINSEIATCLLCGLYTDTGAFQHSNTTPEVLKIAACLLKNGARLKDITKNITNGKTVAALKLWGLVFSRIQKNDSLGLVTAIVTQKDLDTCNATNADLAGAVNMISSIPETRAAILFHELTDGSVKASIRTEKNDVDVSNLARIFGGGGLKKASGFTISGKLAKNLLGTLNA